MYELVYTSRKLVAPPWGQSVGDIQYMAPWDAFFCTMNGMYAGWARLFRDGTLCEFGSLSYQPMLVAREDGLFAYRLGAGTDLLAANEVNGLVEVDQVLNPNWPITSGIYGHPCMADVRNRRYIRGYGTRIAVLDLDNGNQLFDGPIMQDWPYDYIGWAREGVCCCIKYSTGEVKFFDYLLSFSVVAQGQIDPCYIAAYDCMNNVIVTVSQDQLVRVYVMDSLPVTLGNPVFVPSQVLGLKGNTVKVQLTGAAGEPCPGWWIHWLLAGVDGNEPLGMLYKYVSQTDENGWAWNTYFGPSGGGTGQTQIQCSVVTP